METDGKRTAGRRRKCKTCRDESRVVFGPGRTHTDTCVHTYTRVHTHRHTHSHARMTVSGTVVQKRSCEEGKAMTRPQKLVLC